MSLIVDCLLIGHNEMSFDEFISKVRLYGSESVFYRDMALDFISHKDKPYTLAGIYNLLRSEDVNSSDKPGDFCIGNILSPAIAYLGTYLNRRGLTFDYINFFSEQKEELADKLRKGNVRTVGITTTFYLSVSPIVEIIKFIREHNKDVKIIIGGPFILGKLRELDDFGLKAFLRTTGGDFYIDSPQGEAALVHIIKAIKEDKPFDEIDNIIFRKGRDFAFTRKLPEDNLLEENTVDWDMFSASLKTTASVRTAISCPLRCSFCNIPEREGKYQAISVTAVEKELDKLSRIDTVKRINFIDDSFNIPSDRFKDILRMMIKNKYGFKWVSYFRTRSFDREMIELMKESGCEGVFLGLESANPAVLKNMNKFSDVSKYHEIIKLLKEYEIISYVSLIFGFPGETHQTAKDTVDFIKDSRPDFYNANVFYLERYTPIWREREKYKLTGKEFEWEHETMDSKTACSIIEDMFLNVDESTWVPEYNFEFPGIFNLKSRGLDTKSIKEFLNLFNRGIRDRLKGRENIQDSLVAGMRKLL